MKKAIVLPALLGLMLITGAAPAERHIKATLVPNGDSGVTGFVQLTQMPGGGANVVVNARGLQPGTVYASFYYESADCSAPADLLGTFTADDQGGGQVHGKIDEDLDEVGSVSVRVGPDYGTLLACAAVH
jgi:hypothetical protein